MDSRFVKFLKERMLVISMIAGAGTYLIYMNIPAIHKAGPVLETICRRTQPILLFLMLFISFCRIDPRQLKPKKWHIRNLLVQSVVYLTLCSAVVYALHSNGVLGAWILRNRLMFEAGMLCIICPTATACAVVTHRLGGDMAQVITYTVIINLAAAILVPLTIPLLYPSAEITFMGAFLRIIGKVFPLLILPCLVAWTIRYLMPAFHDWVGSHLDLSFYLWSVALMLAILMSTRAIIKSDEGIWTLVGMAIVSLICCIFQFGIGQLIGKRYGSGVEAGQALGQKNTVFGIWMGYTFWNPVVSVAGGFYTIWHNIRNTRQLYRHEHGKQ